MFHLKEVEKSLQFYEQLGFTTIFTEGEPVGYARMECGGGAVAFLRAEKEHPVDAAAQGALLCMYTPDLAGLRDQLVAKDSKVSPIGYPGYMPRGEMNLKDP